MIASIHQPHFLPWLGYFNKVLHSDVFIWLHSVQFRKNYFQNRTRIKNGTDAPFWLTLPVHARLETQIEDVVIAEPRWRNRVQKTVEQFYGKTPYFRQCWPTLSAAITRAPDNLDGVNYQTFLALLQLLEVEHVRVMRAEELSVCANDPNKRLIEMCARVGADRYIAGKGGRNYVRVEEFERAGIAVIWQVFDPGKVVYSQPGNTFVPGLSVIDCLFNVGPEKTRTLIEGAWTP